MKTFKHESSIWVPQPLDEVFAFLSDAHNLEVLTPPWLKFEVLTPRPIQLAVGGWRDDRLPATGPWHSHSLA